MSTNDNAAVARRVMERLDQRDLDGLLAECTPDAVWHGFAPEALDNAGYRQAISAFLDGFPDSRFPIDDVVAEDDRVAVRHRLMGTHQASFQGIPPTGASATIQGIVIFRIVSGKVVETWLNADILGLLQQLGAIPAPEAAGA